MRSLVFTAFILALSMATALAQQAATSVETRCVAPGDCITVNTGPCGSILSVYQGSITALPASPASALQTPGMHGFCGFINAPGANTGGVAYCDAASDCSFSSDPSQITEVRCVNHACVVTSR